MALDTQLTIEEIVEKKQEVISKLEEFIRLVTGKTLEELAKIKKEEFISLEKMRSLIDGVVRNLSVAWGVSIISAKIVCGEKKEGYKDLDQAIKGLTDLLFTLSIWAENSDTNDRVEVEHKKENYEIKNLLDELHLNIHGFIKETKIAEDELVQAGFPLEEAQKIVSVLVKKGILDQ